MEGSDNIRQINAIKMCNISAKWMKQESPCNEYRDFPP